MAVDLWLTTMNYKGLIAIDLHSEAKVSCWNPLDVYGAANDCAADRYFRVSSCLSESTD